jgi:glutamate synthase domain-containing protein 1/glutamate synthase domain-containing protein 3
MCGIFGVYSIEGGDIFSGAVIEGLLSMRERGTQHGAGIALFRDWGREVVKFFAPSPSSPASVKLPGGIYDNVANSGDSLPEGAFVYMRSRWLDVYKIVGWPEDIAKLYDIKSLKSSVWIGHTRYPTNSPGWYPYQSHPFSVGDVAVVHNGDLSSYGSNVNLLRSVYGYGKFSGTDSEVIAHLLWELYRKYGVEDAVLELMYGRRVRWARLDGPYAVAFIIGKSKPIFGAFVDVQHFRPLYVGFDGEVLYVASEAMAIKRVARDAEVWAVRSGEYIIAEGGEVWGNFRKRVVKYLAYPQPPDAIDASRYEVTKLAEVVREELERRGVVNVVNVAGHRYVGNGMYRGVLNVWGVVGNASANVMSGGVFNIYGDAQDDLGDAMNDGVLAVFGNVGDAVGQAKRGGEIYVYGNAGTRAAIQHRGGVMVIGGSAGDYLGEYMGGGVVVVLRKTWDEEVGWRIGSGMVGGTIFIRGEVPRERIGYGFDPKRLRRYLEVMLREGELSGEQYEEILRSPELIARLDGRAELFSVTHRVEVRELSEEELRLLEPYVKRFNSIFNTDIDIRREVFTIIKPLGGRAL